MKITIVKRNKINNPNQEYEVEILNVGNKKMKESEIIKDINNQNNTYITKPNTPVEIRIRNGEKYICSIPNGTTTDNLKNLSTY